MSNECLAFTTEECNFLELNVNLDDIIIGTEVTAVPCANLVTANVVGYQRRRRKWCGVRMRRNRWGTINKV